ncbi:MAG: P-loop NTPase fold protein, partial [Ferruginibacter sp.]
SDEGKKLYDLKIGGKMRPSGEEENLPGEKIPPSPKDVQNDFVGTLNDVAVSEKDDDDLDRYAFAEFLVKLLQNTTISFGAYSVHLYASWGAGKTSVMNFMKQILTADKQKNGRDKWHIVDFNAWQNQSLAYPWWSLMNNIFRTVKNSLSYKHRINEWFWRYNSSWLHYFIAAVFIVFFFILYSGTHTVNPQVATGQVKSSSPEVNDQNDAGRRTKNEIEDIAKIVTGIISISAFSIGLSKSLFVKSVKAAENYINSEQEPMNEFKRRFTKLTNAVCPAAIAIFIDDLDRCKSSYVVELLENIQTLMKGSNVVFIIAADKKWIHACYEVEYEKIKPYVGVEGKTIGPLFVEKMFQVSVALPSVASDIKKKLWYKMLGISEDIHLSPGTKASIENASSVEAREKIIEDTKGQSFEKSHAIRLEVLKTLAEKTTLKQTKHFLEPYNVLVDINPRDMKRLLNSYSVNKASSLLSHIDVPLHELILWTIIEMQWPVLAEYLLDHPSVINLSPEEQKSKTPPYIADLLQDEKVSNVVCGGEIGARLSEDSVKKCRLLYV